ncbi:unnamed protein product [Rhizoctonia solani]|uniref:21S rRNA pseudouridine(2819) synthase n=1 Tax=Rhizoctonia solani TaxID=456999 RepID=A0A8H3ATC3_9AGAM|nr:unnamed protein product [Rhizoctonia solani]
MSAIMTRNLVVFMDRGLIVLNKPAGLVAQGGRHAHESKTKTLDHVLEDLTVSLSLNTKPLPVHRLDRLTTGALILARNPQTAQTLSSQLRRSASNEINKTYLALVHGYFELNYTGEIRKDFYIADGRVSIGKPSDEASYKKAETHTTWRCLASRRNVSLMELGLRTGVKHQLRVSMAQILKAPVLGDPVYGFSCPKDQPRMMLHSARVEILRYLRKPAFGSRTYRLGITVPPPTEFLAMCQKYGLSIAEEWIRSHVRVTVNGSEIPYDNRFPLDEEAVVDALRKFHANH